MGYRRSPPPPSPDPVGMVPRQNPLTWHLDRSLPSVVTWSMGMVEQACHKILHEVAETGKDEVGEKGQEAEEAEEEVTADGPLNDTNVGFQMLVRVWGWTPGTGLGARGQGRLEPIMPGAAQAEAQAVAVQATLGGRSHLLNSEAVRAGLSHASENLRKPLEMASRAPLESWEMEERLRDFYRGSDSSHWVSGGMMQGSLEANDSLAKPAARGVSLTQHKDSWDDVNVSELVYERRSRAGHAAFDAMDKGREAATWEDTWADLENDELEELTINTDHFLACCKVKGPVVRMLHLETTGEVFESSVWAASPRELRAVLKPRLSSRVRVLRPLFRGRGRELRAIFLLLRRVSGEDDSVLNPEASRLAGCRVFGDAFAICRSARRDVQDYRLAHYLKDFTHAADAEAGD